MAWTIHRWRTVDGVRASRAPRSCLAAVAREPSTTRRPGRRWRYPLPRFCVLIPICRLYRRDRSILDPHRRGSRCTGNRRRDPLLEVHEVEPVAARLETGQTIREPFEIPQVDEQPSAMGGVRVCQLDAAFDVVRRGNRNDPSADRPPSRRCRLVWGSRYDGCATAERGVDRFLEPPVLFLRRDERRAIRRTLEPRPGVR